MNPIRPRQHTIDCRSVNFVRTEFGDRGWIFRELGADYGMDAEAEFCGDSEQVSGALVRLQIKGTLSNIGSVLVDRKTLRYWACTPVPTFLIRVNPDTKEMRVVDIMSYVRENGVCLTTTKFKTITIAVGDDLQIDEWFDYMKESALLAQAAAMEIREHTKYDIVFQEISFRRLFYQFCGDINAMVRWYRKEAPDDQLVKEFSHVLAMKNRIVADPAYLQTLREYVNFESE
jgi:hypothetical protein